VQRALAELAGLAEIGAQTALCELTGLTRPGVIELVAERILPAVRSF